MGQNISAIITNQQIEVPGGIVHFREGNCIVLPLEIHPYDVEHFIEEATRFERLQELIAHLQQQEHPAREDDEHSLQTVIEWITALNLETFVLEHHSEWAGMESDCSFILILDGNIVRESAMVQQSEGLDPERYDNYKRVIGLDHYWYCNEDRYYFYHMAKQAYFKL